MPHVRMQIQSQRQSHHLPSLEQAAYWGAVHTAGIQKNHCLLLLHKIERDYTHSYQAILKRERRKLLWLFLDTGKHCTQYTIQSNISSVLAHNRVEMTKVGLDEKPMAQRQVTSDQSSHAMAYLFIGRLCSHNQHAMIPAHSDHWPHGKERDEGHHNGAQKTSHSQGKANTLPHVCWQTQQNSDTSTFKKMHENFRKRLCIRLHKGIWCALFPDQQKLWGQVVVSVSTYRQGIHWSAAQQICCAMAVAIERGVQAEYGIHTVSVLLWQAEHNHTYIWSTALYWLESCNNINTWQVMVEPWAKNGRRENTESKDLSAKSGFQYLQTIHACIAWYHPMSNRLDQALICHQCPGQFQSIIDWPFMAVCSVCG